MLNQAALIVGILLIVGMALVFRRGLKSAENPRFVLESPPMPKDLAAAVLRFEKWKAEGRITREEYEHLMELCRHDAEPRTT